MAGKKGTIRLGSTLVIDETVKIRKDFDKQLAKSDTITISSDEINQLDLAGVQLLQYVENKAKSASKSIVLNLKFDEEVKSLLLKNGFTNLI